MQRKTGLKSLFFIISAAVAGLRQIPTD